ncbi:craniofacial development protein 1 [Anopheles arabiensis]|uniref:craniofacial development protein 1 n=1 Tax=Anopheles arabiensis TaxID=7173 RepID=UPI001AAD176F|nr:craniofacial development protein 1 [Anopheles arabiensis]
MNQEDYPSDSDASDEDFRPDKEVETGSELDSNDEEQEECGEQLEGKSSNGGGAKRKRKSVPTSRKKTKANEKEVKAHEKAHRSDEEKDEELDEEEEKRRTDALWADFLGGGGSSATSSSTSSTQQANGATSTRTSKPSVEVKKPVTEVKSSPRPKLFEFAGEQIVLTEEGGSKILASAESEKSSTVSTRPAAPKSTIPSRSSSGGLGAVLNQLSKKNQLSTLEKTKLDWTSFKRQEGIEEELQTHNKGKEGFLERRDFLERTDLRQFEIEKSFRQTKRSNR